MPVPKWVLQNMKLFFVTALLSSILFAAEAPLTTMIPEHHVSLDSRYLRPYLSNDGVGEFGLEYLQFQQFAFDQPNLAILQFPFSWLACCVVPLVLFSHLVCLSFLFKKK